MNELTINDIVELYNLGKDTVRYRIRESGLKPIGKTKRMGRGMSLYKQSDIQELMSRNWATKPKSNVKKSVFIPCGFDNVLAKQFIMGRIHVN